MEETYKAGLNARRKSCQIGFAVATRVADLIGIAAEVGAGVVPETPSIVCAHGIGRKSF